MTDAISKPLVLVLVRDLMFCSKITATASAANIPFKVIRDPAKLAGEVGDRLIVDLNQPQTIEAAAQWRAATGRPAIGFVSHVDVEAIAAANAAGIDRVMARSQFVQQLPMLLAEPV
jgi:hypothetical protein